MIRLICLTIFSFILFSCGGGKTYTKEAEIAIKNMIMSVGDYYLNNGSMPSDCYEEMEEFGYIEMKQSIIDGWNFQCDWEFDKTEREIVGTVSATTTEENDTGWGLTIIYDIYEGEFSGYGQGNSGN